MKSALQSASLQARWEPNSPTTTAPEKKKGYTYSSLPSLTGGPKRKIYKQPKKR